MSGTAELGECKGSCIQAFRMCSSKTYILFFFIYIFQIFSQKLEQLENRLRHSRFAIERSYLLFEIARCHFQESRFDKCLVVARKAFNGGLHAT